MLESTDLIARETAKSTGQLAVLTSGIGDDDSFELSLNIDSYHSNVTNTVTIYMLVYEFDPSKDNEYRWIAEQQLSQLDPDYVELYNPSSIKLTLPLCRGNSDVPAEVSLNDLMVVGYSFPDSVSGMANTHLQMENGLPLLLMKAATAQSSTNVMFIGIGALYCTDCNPNLAILAKEWF